MSEHKVNVLPNDIEIYVAHNTSLKEAFIENGLNFEFQCGGTGVCKQCKVKIIKNTGQEEVLACQLKVIEDLTVEIPVKSNKHRILATGIERQVKLNPIIKKSYIQAPNPSLEDNRDDWSRITAETKMARTNLKVLQELPEKLRENNFNITAVTSFDEIIAIENQDTRKELLGMAFDIGTTTIAGYLLNLESGEEIARVSALNPQTKYGADLISRIVYASQTPNGLEKLHKELIEQLNGLIAQAVNSTGYTPIDVYAVTAAGNTAMHHLLLKIQPRNLAGSPYVPVIVQQVTVNAAELNLKINPAGRLFALPNIAGYVGGDTVAATLVSQMYKDDKLKLLIDIGTNGEIVLGNSKKLISCSVAAGPAFEGVQIKCGMRGDEGAIDHVFIGEEFKYTVIGERQPLGIAGSGIVDMVAELLKAGIVDSSGRILKPEKITNNLGIKHKERLKNIDDVMAFIICENVETGKIIYINQKDIREFQLAKGAIAAGIEVLLKEYGAIADDIDEVFLAGAFGSYLK
ncbi:MAG: ASKHA domain-containing protein, partial [Tissierellia bacterium]|nr:ASKHA domain-containing protein [Tissierellia bacterium]